MRVFKRRYAGPNEWQGVQVYSKQNECEGDAIIAQEPIGAQPQAQLALLGVADGQIQRGVLEWRARVYDVNVKL